MNKEWFDSYNKIKMSLRSKIDLDKCFSEKEIDGVKLDVISIGELEFPSGEIIACDPSVDIENASPFIQKIKKGKHKVYIAVCHNDINGSRYAVVKVLINDNKPLYYDLALTGLEENLDSLEADEYYGFAVDTGLGCVLDRQTQDKIIDFFNKDEDNFDKYNDLIEEKLKQSAKDKPKYQSSYGDYANFSIDGSSNNLAIFHSGFGDGYYPSYFAYDKNDEICAFYIQFIDVFHDFKDE